MAEGIGAGTLETPPPLPSPSLPAALCHWLWWVFAWLCRFSVFSCSDPLAGWLRKMCFRCPVILGIKGIHPSPFWCVLPYFPDFLLLWFPVGYWRSTWRRASVSIQPRVRERITCTCSARCFAGLCLVDHGTSLRGLGTKENVLLGRAGSKETGQEVGLGSGSLSWIPEGWVSKQGDPERNPASNFPLPFPELVQGLEECPWSVGPVLSVIHLSVPTFKWQSSPWPCHGQSMSGIPAWLLRPNLELRKYMHRSQRDMSLYLTVHKWSFFFFSFWCNKVCFGRRRKRLWVWEGLWKGRMGSSDNHTSHLGLKLSGRKCSVNCVEAENLGYMM